MREPNPFHENKEELNDLLQNYYNLKRGLKHTFLEEESFEKIIDYFDGFSGIKQVIKTRSKVKILWIFGLLAFVLSAIIDNLTATLVMIAIYRKITEETQISNTKI